VESNRQMLMQKKREKKKRQRTKKRLRWEIVYESMFDFFSISLTGGLGIYGIR
jgi:hypothetical protein